eukprot:XP_001696133.1 predicted protein [Chlamydomonas reinhardtii]
MPPPDAKARKAAAKRGPGMPYGDDDEEEEEDAPTIANPEEAEALKKLAEKLAADLAKQKAAAEERRRNAEGRGAATVYRDKATGRVMTAEEAADAKGEGLAVPGDPPHMVHRGAKPFARHDVDDLHDSSLKGARGVAPPANRYNIRPGRHWDGVNRSNGFEADLFKYQNMRAAKELEARLWSMGDM